MKTFLIEKGIVVDGKVIPWEVFYKVLNSTGIEQKALEKIKKKLNGIVMFNKISIEQGNYLAEVAIILGVKVVDNDRVLKANIFKKIERLNK